jgi:CheY-like chemotaxis protein
MRFRTEQLSGPTSAQQVIRIYENNPVTNEDELIYEMILDADKPPLLLFSALWPDDGPLSSSSRMPTAVSDESPTVLVVDDDVSIQKLAVTALNHLGHVAVGCTDIPRATEIINKTPSLRVLLSDICLESGTGPDLVRRVRVDRPELKVVFMTGGYSNVSFRRTDPVLRKPFTIEHLQQTIETVLNRRGTEFEQFPRSEERRRVG